MLLIKTIRSNFPTLTTDVPDENSYVYICTNDEWLLAVGQSTSSRADALSGEITSQKHTKAGICMMASTIKGKLNIIHYIECNDSDLDKTEKDVKEIARAHYGLTNRQQGGTFIDTYSKNEEVSLYLKEKLLDSHRRNGIEDFDKKCFSLNDILDFVGKDGDAWSNLLASEITKDIVKKFLSKN